MTRANKKQIDIPGGTTGQALVKLSNTDYDYDWGAGGGYNQKQGCGTRVFPSGTDTIVHGLGAVPRFIKIRAVKTDPYTGGHQNWSDGIYDVLANTYTTLYMYNIGSNTTNTKVLYVRDGGPITTATIANVTNISFDLVISVQPDINYLWEVIA